MVLIACPACGVEGKAPDHVLGKKIKCHACGLSFQAGPVVAPPVAPSPSPGTIEIDDLAPSTWNQHLEIRKETPPVEAGPERPASALPEGVQARQYKVLTQKDRWFEGKFDLTRLEDALNHYAREGWVVRAMSTPHVMGFSGGPSEEIVVLLER